MKRITLFVVALFCASVFAQDLPKIAVYVSGLEDANVSKAMAARMLSTLANSGRYSASERQTEFMDLAAAELKKQSGGAVNYRQITETGKQFGVSFVCVVDVMPALGSHLISARIIDVQSSVTAAMADADSPLKTLQDLSDASAQIAAAMFRTPAAVQQAQRVTPAPPVQQIMPAPVPIQPPPPVQQTIPAPVPIQPPPPVQEASPIQQAKPNTPLTNFRDESVGMDMVFVKGGTFMMGCTDERECGNNEKPPRMVTLSGFYIGKYEITQKQWVQVMGSNPSYFNGDDRPVEKVSWNDIQTFILRLNNITGKRYRLPTEAEWEYAARGGTNSGYKYSGGNAIGDVGWYSNNSDEKTSPVGGKQPNEFGIYDMTGNVAEWVSDYYDTYAFSNVTTNPKGPVSGVYRTVRGGSYYHFTKNCRVSYRGGEKPDVRRSSVGFRLALDARDTGPVQLSQTQQGYPYQGYPQQDYPQDGYTQRSAYVDFSLGERWGTWAVNTFLPGVGSIAIMQDWNGAIAQWSLVGGGIFLMVVGWSETSYYYREPNALYWIGTISVGLVDPAYNIIRSVTYKKKIPQNAASVENTGLNVAVLPDKDGNIKGYVAYRVEF